MDPEDPRLYHKTTLRPEKYTLRAKAKELGLKSALFLNTRNEFSEGTISSFIFKVKGKWIAPELSCGLLPGVWRDHQVNEGRVREGIVTFDHIEDIEEIRIGNSVRGEERVVRVILEDGTEVYREKLAVA
ncbi:MAG: aminotransferase class IV [bacterium]|nr:aminotransferase class IV [bacterium]